MRSTERVTVTLPGALLREIDRQERNRSRFVQEAVRRELARRRREALRVSVENPHADSAEISVAGFDEWAASLQTEDASGLVDASAGKPVCWVRDSGWIETGK